MKSLIDRKMVGAYVEGTTDKLASVISMVNIDELANDYVLSQSFNYKYEIY